MTFDSAPEAAALLIESTGPTTARATAKIVITNTDIFLSILFEYIRYASYKVI